MPDDCPDEEPVVCDGLPLGHLGRAQVQVHAVVVARDGFDGEVGEPVDLQLEGQGWFKVAVNCVLFKLWGEGQDGGERVEQRGEKETEARHSERDGGGGVGRARIEEKDKEMRGGGEGRIDGGNEGMAKEGRKGEGVGRNREEREVEKG